MVSTGPNLKEILSGGVGLVRRCRIGVWDETWDSSGHIAPDSTPTRDRIHCPRDLEAQPSHRAPSGADRQVPWHPGRRSEQAPRRMRRRRHPPPRCRDEPDSSLASVLKQRRTRTSDRCPLAQLRKSMDSPVSPKRWLASPGQQPKTPTYVQRRCSRMSR